MGGLITILADANFKVHMWPISNPGCPRERNDLLNIYMLAYCNERLAEMAVERKNGLAFVGRVMLNDDQITVKIQMLSVGGLAVWSGYNDGAAGGRQDFGVRRHIKFYAVMRP
jgi:hypothetical protein